jgi:predicted  nucleic acid-binding Zn ribbon protein
MEGSEKTAERTAVKTQLMVYVYVYVNVNDSNLATSVNRNCPDTKTKRPRKKPQAWWGAAAWRGAKDAYL